MTKGGGVEITVTIPDELAARLRPVEKELPQILELGNARLDCPERVGILGADGCA